MSDAEATKPPAAQSVAILPEEKKQRGRRNLSIALGLGVFVVLVFAVTILRLGGAVIE